MFLINHINDRIQIWNRSGLTRVGRWTTKETMRYLTILINCGNFQAKANYKFAFTHIHTPMRTQSPNQVLMGHSINAKNNILYICLWTGICVVDWSPSSRYITNVIIFRCIGVLWRMTKQVLIMLLLCQRIGFGIDFASNDAQAI